MNFLLNMNMARQLGRLLETRGQRLDLYPLRQTLHPLRLGVEWQRLALQRLLVHLARLA